MAGHTLRHNSLTKNVVESHVEGYIGRGRPRTEYMTEIGKDSYK